MRPKIISIDFAVPDNVYSQEEVFAELKYPAAFWRVFKESQITRRHFWVPLSLAKKLSFQEQQEHYCVGARTLAEEAMHKCLDGRDPADTGCLTFSSCTGFAPGPTIPHFLAKKLKLSPDTYYTNIASQGCESAFPGLRRAYDFTHTTGKASLVIAAELSSCSYFPEPDGKADPENHYELLRANALFADACICALVGFDSDWRHPVIVDMETHTNTDYIDDLGYQWRDGRLRVRLSRRVPFLAPAVVKPAVETVLARNGLKVSDITWWIIHAAGSTVLDNIRDRLGIDESKITLSRETLSSYGNTSATSVGITGKRLMSQNIQKGDYAAVLSVGPGMTGGMTLLHFEGE